MWVKSVLLVLYLAHLTKSFPSVNDKNSTPVTLNKEDNNLSNIEEPKTGKKDVNNNVKAFRNLVDEYKEMLLSNLDIGKEIKKLVSGEQNKISKLLKMFTENVKYLQGINNDGQRLNSSSRSETRSKRLVPEESMEQHHTIPVQELQSLEKSAPGINTPTLKSQTETTDMTDPARTMETDTSDILSTTPNDSEGTTDTVSNVPTTNPSTDPPTTENPSTQNQDLPVTESKDISRASTQNSIPTAPTPKSTTENNFDFWNNDDEYDYEDYFHGAEEAVKKVKMPVSMISFLKQMGLVKIHGAKAFNPVVHGPSGYNPNAWLKVSDSENVRNRAIGLPKVRVVGGSQRSVRDQTGEASAPDVYIKNCVYRKPTFYKRLILPRLHYRLESIRKRLIRKWRLFHLLKRLIKRPLVLVKKAKKAKKVKMYKGRKTNNIYIQKSKHDDHMHPDCPKEFEWQ